MKRMLCLLVCLLVHGATVYAQSGISGQVLDAQTKEPLSGVSIHVKQALSGTQTNPDGSFSLAAATPTDTVVYFFVGYKQKAVAVANHQRLVLLQPSSNLLHQVVVSASREAQVRTDAPVAISAISKEVLLETKPTSLEQVLNKVSGVYMVNLGNEQHTMAIRQPIGYKSLFLYLEDGIPIRTGGNFNHNALIEINMASLKTIEVIRGPASSLYGSEAIGGAINFITQAPSQVFTARLQAEASDRGYRRTDFSVSNTIGKLGIYVAGYYATQRNGIIEHSDFDKLALTLRTDYALSDRTKLVSTASLIDYETEQTGGLDSKRFYAKEYSSLHTFTYRKVNAFRLRSTLEHDWDQTNSTRVTAFYRNNSIGQNPFYAIRNNAANPLIAKGEINEDAFQSFGLLAQHRKSFSFLNAQLIGGLSADYSPAAYVAEEIAIDRDDAGKYIQYAKSDVLLTNYEAQLLNTAAYAQFELNPVNRLKALAAIRYDRLDFDFNNHLEPGAFSGAPDERNGFNSLTPKLGLTYDLGKGMGLYGNYSAGFTPPQISELYRGVQVPTLKPASYYNHEAGGWISFAQATGYLDLSVYQLDGQNEIVSVRLDDGSYENQNAGKTRHRGVEYTLRYQPAEAIAFRFSGTNARHTYLDFVERGIDFSGKEMATAPRFISNTELTYKPAFVSGLRMSLEWQHLGKYFLDPANTERYSGYDLLNARLGYSISGFEVWINMLNLTNQLYATTADKYAYGHSYRQGSPRTTHIGIAYNFSAKAN
ncbi:TonB-dependent receptor [Pontibacter qinzhouensis]|uniref:TonB-dependent receptor n=1 Tax=Pontibacter qinzhouensis TaxID=2603253 RepID=A0A5C8K940_9BACT|nr:TonB-dependent receptor [Pontibacter qinzhouensis]TXK48747.1 TonB-dependent receptor [Pontibacter qinzhouensis]